MASPGRGGLSFQRVLVDWDSSLRQNLDLDKVVPALVDRKVVPRRLGKGIVKKKDATLLLSYLKQKPLDDFVSFLEVLESLGDDEKHKELMKRMSESLKLMDLSPESHAARTVASFLESSQKEKESDPNIKSLTATLGTSQSQTCIDIPSLQPITTHATLSHETESEPLACGQETPAPTESKPVIVSPSSQSALTLPSEMSSFPQNPHSQSAIVSAKHKTDHVQTLSSSAEQPESITIQSPPTNPASQQPIRPPPGYIGSKSMKFNKAGGTFYCPVHGVTVHISPEAIPPDIDQFVLGAHVYLQGPFKVPSDVELCTPVVWLYLYPNFTFSADVLLKIPHSIAQCSEEDVRQFYLLRASSGQLQSNPNELSEIIEADFSNGYHAVARVRHFSPYAGVCVKKNTTKKKHAAKSKGKAMLKRLRSSSRGSSMESQSSVDESPSGSEVQVLASTRESQESPNENSHSSNESSDVNSQYSHAESPSTVSNAHSLSEFCITRCMPRDRSTQCWEAAFLVTHCHPSTLSAVRLTIEEWFGPDCDISMLRRFQFEEEELEFKPSQWCGDEWSVFVTETNQLFKEDVTFLQPSIGQGAQQHHVTELGLSLPRITYAVQSSQHPPTKPLRCEIEVVGAKARGRRPLVFVLTSTVAAPLSCREGTARVLTTGCYLYPEGSQMLWALSDQSSGADLRLDLQDGDHCKLLADISLQLSDSSALSRELGLEAYQAERISADYAGDEAEKVYQVLTSWVARHSSVTLRGLLQALSGLKIVSLQLTADDSDSHAHTDIVDPRLDSICIRNRPFMLDIGTEIQHRWKFIGRLMGVSESQISRVESDNPQHLQEQSYQMLLAWQTHSDPSATYGTLFKAIHRVHRHDPYKVSDAWVHAIRHSTNLDDY